MSKALTYIIAGGGTGGHLYPAIAVAEQIKKMRPSSKIVFIGTKKKIEARVVPKLGYDFKTIWISGFARKLTFKNLLFPFKVIVSVIQSIFINLKYNPDAIIGAGAYVSGPIAFIGSFFRAKIILLEQNSYPGVTNRMLETKADSIHLSFSESKKYFKNSNKLKLSGNPVRTTLKKIDRELAINKFLLNGKKNTLLILGGSLGAGSLNKVVSDNINKINDLGLQLIWQTGGNYLSEYKYLENERVRIFSFFDDMAAAYSACDLLIARAGATTIAEVAHLGIPTVFVPSVNVAANHQYMNAKSLSDSKAGLLIEDKDLDNQFIEIVSSTITNKILLNELSENIKKYSKPNAAQDIVNDILKLTGDKGI